MSKKTQRIFPSLFLVNVALLPSDSDVNIRHVYSIDWSLVQPYYNSYSPNLDKYSFERESTIKLLAKTQTLTLYEPGLQYRSSPSLTRSVSKSVKSIRTRSTVIIEEPTEVKIFPSEQVSVASVVRSTTPSLLRAGLCKPSIEQNRIAGPLPPTPPDIKTKTPLIMFDPETIRRPFDLLTESVQNAVVSSGGRPGFTPLDVDALSQPAKRFWRNVKGVTAVLYASL